MKKVPRFSLVLICSASGTSVGCDGGYLVFGYIVRKGIRCA